MKLTPKQMATLIVVVVAILAVITFGSSTVFTVAESEQAVITTFGKYTRTEGAGLNIKLPWPIQSVTILPVNLTQKIELGYFQNEDSTYTSVPEESNMITGDMNIVNIDFFVEWKISDPYKYLYTTNNPDLILKNMIQGAVRAVVGTRNIDDVLTIGKIQIQADVKEMLTESLQTNDIGLMILDVKINDSEPPTEDVAKAFRDVETAKQQKATAINQALEYQNGKIPAAQAQADKIVKDAEGAKQAKINLATGEKDKFQAMFNEYQNFPAITRQRMYLEMIEDILPGVKVYIDDSTGTSKLLPLESFTASGSSTNTESGVN
ncbi:MAG: FtsH protease activity modulator HflK [Eubacteriales bacterium]|nr:FtsH protease activity modulator HflK [Eubacteriales bacterium]